MRRSGVRSSSAPPFPMKDPKPPSTILADGHSTHYRMFFSRDPLPWYRPRHAETARGRRQQRLRETARGSPGRRRQRGENSVKRGRRRMPRFRPDRCGGVQSFCSTSPLPDLDPSRKERPRLPRAVIRISPHLRSRERSENGYSRAACRDQDSRTHTPPNPTQHAWILPSGVDNPVAFTGFQGLRLLWNPLAESTDPRLTPPIRVSRKGKGRPPGADGSCRRSWQGRLDPAFRRV